jgi:RNA polymerase sigma factor (sigma-70 family)
MRSWLVFDSRDSREPDLPDPRGLGSLEVESRDLLRRFYAFLDRLTPRDRLVFILRRVEGMGIEEIAATMKVSDSTVKRSMVRASKRLSRWMGDDPPAEKQRGESDRGKRGGR